MNPNKGKVKWIIVLGKCNLSHVFWQTNSPNPDTPDVWYQNRIYSTKSDAAFAAQEYRRTHNLFLAKVQKYVARKIDGVKVLP
jgi:hypothetical protein